MSPQHMVELLEGGVPSYLWRPALCRWFFTADCDDNTLMQYKLDFGGTDWWMSFIDELVVPHLATKFIGVSVDTLNPGYKEFDMLMTRWMPVVPSHSTMEKALKKFVDKWYDGLHRMLRVGQPTEE